MPLGMSQMAQLGAGLARPLLPTVLCQEMPALFGVYAARCCACISKRCTLGQQCIADRLPAALIPHSQEAHMNGLAMVTQCSQVRIG